VKALESQRAGWLVNSFTIIHTMNVLEHPAVQHSVRILPRNQLSRPSSSGKLRARKWKHVGT